MVMETGSPAVALPSCLKVNPVASQVSSFDQFRTAARRADAWNDGANPSGQSPGQHFHSWGSGVSIGIPF
jgi:hypothetical protein